MAETTAIPAVKAKLGLRDVTLMSIACIMGTRWIPAAAHAGPGSILLWLAAALLFAAPLADAAGALAVKYPGSAGGLYVWTREDFGPWHGFLCFWVYWIGIAFLLPTAALFYMSAGFTALGPKYSHLGDNRFYLLAAALVAIWIALGTNLRGVDVGKWTQNVGAIACWALGVALVLLAVLVSAKRGSATPIHVLPKFNWETVNFWSNIAYGLSGVEMAAMMAAEIRDPARTIPRAVNRSIWIVAILYLTMNLSILGVIPWQEAMKSTNIAAVVMERVYGRPIAVAFTWLVIWAVVACMFSITLGYSRIPYAAARQGDFFSPFAWLHPRGRFPIVSLLTLGSLTAVCCYFPLQDVIDAAVAVRILIMFIGQTIGLHLLRKLRPDFPLPFRMRLYPLPSLIALVGWIFLLATSNWQVLATALGVTASGVPVFFVWKWFKSRESA